MTESPFAAEQQALLDAAQNWYEARRKLSQLSDLDWQALRKRGGSIDAQVDFLDTCCDRLADAVVNFRNAVRASSGGSS